VLHFHPGVATVPITGVEVEATLVRVRRTPRVVLLARLGVFGVQVVEDQQFVEGPQQLVAQVGVVGPLPLHHRV